MTARKAPAGLGGKARRLWSDIAGNYELRFDELRILEDACYEVDLIEGMRDELALATQAGEWLVTGSMKQEVAHPLIGELRQHRALLATLLGKLKLPDADTDAAPISRSEAGRALVNSRWSRTS